MTDTIRWSADVEMAAAQSGAPVTWHLADEVPVALVYSRMTHAVMLASPQDLEDFAVGFSLSERIADRAADIEAIDIFSRPKGIELHMKLASRCLERLQIKAGRAIAGRSGCGLCGVDSVERLYETLPRVADVPVPLDPATVARAVAGLAAHQPLKTLNRSVHGAAFVGPDGGIRLAREDVGRHNALDKLIGAMARAGQAMDDGFVLMTSRASYEIVEKAALAGVTGLVALSAPTAFAVRRAREANLSLANWAHGQLTVF